MDTLYKEPRTADRRAREHTGFTLTEIVVSLGIIALILSIASFSAIGAKARTNKKICLGNQQQIFNSLTEYGNNNACTVGTAVSMSTLVSKNYLKPMGRMACPANEQEYASTQFYGKAPRCPAHNTNHVFTP